MSAPLPSSQHVRASQDNGDSDHEQEEHTKAGKKWKVADTKLVLDVVLALYQAARLEDRRKLFKDIDSTSKASKSNRNHGISLF